MKSNKISLLLTTLFVNVAILTSTCFIDTSPISSTVLAAYASPYAEPTILIKKGTYGTGVKWVQDMLNHNGYNLEIDGAFGSHTLSAVLNFQNKYGLAADGIVGNATKSALKNHATTSSSSSNNTNSTGSSSSSDTSINNITNTKQYYTTANLNLRNGASTSYSIILTIPKSASVTIISSNSNGWALVKYKSSYGFVSKKYLTTNKPIPPISSENANNSTNTNSSINTNNSTNSSPNHNSNSSKLPVFTRNSNNLMTIIKNCKSYYANNDFYYSLANGVRSIPADKSLPYGTYNRYYTDCSNYVSWVLYEYALANEKINMKNYFSYQRNSAKFKSIGDNGGNSYLSVISKKTTTSNVNLASAKPGDILVSPGHVEFFNSYTMNSNGTVALKVYNCGSTASIQAQGITTSATKYLNEITYILRVK